MTRRLFVKRTGGATIASALAWSLSTQKSRAHGAESLPEGSGPSEIHVATTRFSDLDVTVTYTASGPIEGILLGIAAVYDSLEGGQQGRIYEIGNPNDYEEIEKYTFNPLDDEEGIHAVNNGDGTYTATADGPFTLRHTHRQRK